MPKRPDQEELTREVEDILRAELGRTEAARRELTRTGQLAPLTEHDLLVLRDADEELLQAGRRLLDLLDVPPTIQAIPRFAYALRRSVTARTALLRHTPPISGQPRALDPAQHARSIRKPWTIDYARSGAQLFLNDERGLSARDHPLLRQATERIIETIYPERPLSALLFSSGMGAINTALDDLAHEARHQGRTNVIGGHSWMEVQEYVRVEHPDVFDFVDETDAAALARALSNPSILGVCLETIVNHPDMPVVPLLTAARSSPKAEDKVLLLDCAHTPEYHAPAVRACLPTTPILTVVSGVKFLQAGWDLSKAGLISIWPAPKASAIASRMMELRERSGRTPSYEEAFLASFETRSSFTSRLARYDRNTELTAQKITHATANLEGVMVCSPWLADHQGYETARTHYGTGGRFLYVRYAPEHFGPDAALRIERAIGEKASAEGRTIVSACTFGLASPHINVIVHPVEGPVLRISPGSAPWEEIESTIDLCAHCLARPPAALSTKISVPRARR